MNSSHIPHYSENEPQRQLLRNTGADYFLLNLQPDESPILSAFMHDNVYIFNLLSSYRTSLRIPSMHDSLLEYAFGAKKLRIAKSLVRFCSVDDLQEKLQKLTNVPVIKNSEYIAFLKDAIQNHPSTISKNDEQLSLQFIASLKQTAEDIKKQLLEAAKYSFLDAWRYLLQFKKVQDELRAAIRLHDEEAYYQTDQDDYHTNQLKKILANEIQLPRMGLGLDKNDDIAYAMAESILMDETFLNLNLDFIPFTKENKIQLLLCFLCDGDKQDTHHHLLRRALNALSGRTEDSLPELGAFIPNVDTNNIDYEKLILKYNSTPEEFWKTRDGLYEKVQKLLQISLDHPELPSLQDKVTKEAEKYLVLTRKQAMSPAVDYYATPSTLTTATYEYRPSDRHATGLIPGTDTDAEIADLLSQLAKLITQLKLHGETLPDPKGPMIATLVKQLQSELDCFSNSIKTQPSSIKHEFTIFHETMKNILHKEQNTESLYKHSNELNVWLANFMVALTGIGLLVIIGNMVYTAIKEPNEANPTFTHLLLFGKTATQQKMTAIEVAIDNKLPELGIDEQRFGYNP